MSSDDVPSPIDLRLPADAHAWTREADVKRPHREQLRALFAAHLGNATRVLELGSGPGLLAEHLLRTCPIASYTLFDFSRPMLELSRERIGAHPAATFVLGDFKQPGWAARLASPYDAIVAMQSIHEVRHKRHLPGLYRDVHTLLPPGGRFLVCDHVPADANPLFATEAEQHAALRSAGFTSTTIGVVETLYLIAATA
ncbi:MAG: class I SAM-dependent methyltransferase [Kofleriaceae bacterium]